MDNKDLISVIVPVYNVEPYLRKCLDSIINQTYKNLEIILIDDGSTDKSGEICDEYGKKDERVKVVHKENGGLSDARNNGIKVATGKYITFVDSDDTVDKEYVGSLYKIIKKYSVNIAIAPHEVISKNKCIDFGSGYKEKILNQEETLKRMLLDEGYTVSAWSKLYLLELFDDIEFPKGKIYEDIATTYKLILKCNKVGYTNESHYNYFKRDGTITTSKFNETKLSFIEFSDYMGKDILKIYPNLYGAVESKKVEARFSILRQVYFSKDYKKFSKIIDEINYYLKSKRKIILKDKNMKRRNKIALCLLLLGKNVFRISCKIYYKLKY